MKMFLICYCAFAYGFEFSTMIDFLADEYCGDTLFSSILIFSIAFILFLLAPIVMPINWLLNTIQVIRSK